MNIKQWVAIPAAAFLFLTSSVQAMEVIQPVNSSTSASPRTHLITVSGKGELSVQPDVATIQLGFVSEGDNAKIAQSRNAETFTQIQKALKQKGIPAGDIKTIRYTVSPRYEWEKDKNVLKGYQTDHMIQIKYRNIQGVGQLLDDISQTGANRVEQISFGLDDPQAYEIQVLELAMDNAKKKADALAKKAGRSVKQVIEITESNVENPNYETPIRYMDAEKATDSSTPTPISQGELKIHADVKVVYEF